MIAAMEITCILAQAQPGEKSPLSPWLLVLFFGGLALMIILPRLAKRSKVQDEPRRTRPAQPELRQSMDRLLVELQETAREINASIDTKMIALNRLIEEADRKIETLRKLGLSAGVAASPRRPDAPVQPKREPATPVEKPSSPEDTHKRQELEREICRLADEGKTELEIARLTGTPRGEVELVLSLRRMPGDRP